VSSGAEPGESGYLPAEHIETPTERLARLNKHRNIDVGAPQAIHPPTTGFAADFFFFFPSQLAQAMLGDNPEKSRNPLKKAMRRRNAKTVTFSEPTYFEASENDYSTEEEDAEEGEYPQAPQNGQAQEQAESAEHDQPSDGDDDDVDVVEPLEIRRPADRAAKPDETAKTFASRRSEAGHADEPQTNQGKPDRQGMVNPEGWFGSDITLTIFR
jgi:hypothetical protein